MKMRCIFIFLACLGVSFHLFSQQTTRYNQYLLCNYLLNPASAGTNNKLEFMAGQHRQWIGLADAPTTTFFSTTYTYRSNFNYRGSHGFGAFVEQDKRGMLMTKSVYASYAYHLFLSSGLKLAFGMFVGGKSVGLSAAAYNYYDPAMNQTRKMVYLFPDFIPGFRLYSKSMSLDISVRQLVRGRVRQSGTQIGTSDSKQIPHLYITYGQKFYSPTNDFVFFPSIHIQSAINTRPLIDLGLMVSYHGRLGVGLAYTYNNSVTSILQLQLMKEAFIGISSSFGTNNLRYVASNTTEIVLGFTPVAKSDKDPGSRRVARCPSFDY